MPASKVSGLLGFPNIKGTFLGVPIKRTTIFWGLYLGAWARFFLLAFRLWMEYRVWGSGCRV